MTTQYADFILEFGWPVFFRAEVDISLLAGFMARRSFRSCVWLLASVAAGLGTELLSPVAVQAGCGDYVHLGRGGHLDRAGRLGNSPAMNAGHAMSDRGNDSVDAAELMATNSIPAGGGRCHSPACRGEQRPPAVPAPAAPPSAAEHWACLLGMFDRHILSVSRLQIDSALVHPGFPSGRIERPPRAAF